MAARLTAVLPKDHGSPWLLFDRRAELACHGHQLPRRGCLLALRGWRLFTPRPLMLLASLAKA